jgi:EAL domain-containing protein (putative c-di-GMP-specific phosphodiesterase class I)/GGDEF domain-containing protein
MKKFLKNSFNESNILKLNVISYMIIIAFLVISLGGFYLFLQYNNYKKMINSATSDILTRKKEALKTRAENIIQIIQISKESNEEFIEYAIMNHVEMAYNIATHLYNKYKGKKNIVEIKELIVDALRKIKFAIGDSYIWVNDLNGQAILQPKAEYLEGNNLLKEAKPEISELVRRELLFLENHDEGFLEINFFTDKSGIAENGIIYLKKFAPLNWYFGTGVSINYVNEYVKQSVLKLLNTRSFNKLDSFIIRLFEVDDLGGASGFAKILVDPINPENIGNYLNDNDKNSKKYHLVKNNLEKLRKMGFVFIEDSIAARNIKDKNELTYLYYYKPFNWIISVNSNLNEINSLIEKGKSRLKDELVLQSIISFLLFALFGGIAFFISIFFANIIWKIFTRYREEIMQKTEQLIFARDELKRRLYFDSETGLPSNNKLREDLEIIRNESEHYIMGIICLDNFKILNNYYGWKVGNDIFKIFTQEVEKYMEGTNYSIYRYREDSLVVLSASEGIPNKEALEQMANKFVEYMNNRSFNVPEYDFEIDLIVYFVITYDAIYPFEALGLGIEEAKRDKTYYMVYDKFYVTLSYYENTIIWSRKVKNALIDNRIVPFFQPIFDKRGDLLSYECLVRLIDDNGDIISPGFFLEITKKSNLYTQITKVMFDRCFKYFHGKSINFSINTSIEDFFDKECFTYIKAVLERYRDMTHFFTFEIIETEGIKDYDLFNKYIITLKNEFNVKFAIDDFGTGYSNFSHIINLDIDYLKIDGSLVKNLDKDENAKIVVSSIIYFAKQLNIPTIAEFVHSKEIVDITHQLGFDYFQGFYLGGPQREILNII